MGINYIELSAKDVLRNGVRRLTARLSGTKRLLSSREQTEEALAALRDSQPPFKPDLEGFDNVISTRTVAAARCVTFTPRWVEIKKHVIYFPGGLVRQPTREQLLFADEIAAKARCPVTLLAYPLAPTYSYADAYECAARLFAELAEKLGAENVLLMGDAAGGSIALAVCGYFARAGLPKPGGVIAISPVCDMSLGTELKEDGDPLLSAPGLRAILKSWCGFRFPTDGTVNPMTAEADAIPETLLLCSDSELLFADICRFAVREGIRERTRLCAYRGLLHGFVFDAHLDAAKGARQRIVNRIRDTSNKR